MRISPVDASDDACARGPHRCPRAEVEIDAPRDRSGEWVLDLRKGKRHMSISWRSDFGFGLFTAAQAGIGDRPDEIYTRAEEASARVCHQLANSGHGPRFMGLKDLRHLRGTSQMALADAMRIDQAAVSRIEARDNMHLSSLVQYIEAMGGQVEIRARFDEFEARIDPRSVTDQSS